MTITPWWALVGVLAAFRITRLIVLDVILYPPRDWLVKKMPSRSKITTLIDCPHCSGIYVCLGVLLVLAGWGEVGHWLLLPWAIAGAQSLLSSTDHALNR